MTSVLRRRGAIPGMSQSATFAMAVGLGQRHRLGDVGECCVACGKPMPCPALVTVRLVMEAADVEVSGVYSRTQALPLVRVQAPARPAVPEVRRPTMTLPDGVEGFSVGGRGARDNAGGFDYEREAHEGDVRPPVNPRPAVPRGGTREAFAAPAPPRGAVGTADATVMVRPYALQGAQRFTGR
jgi:hypothetical protein